MDKISSRNREAAIAQRATVLETPCADGTMPFRQWNTGAPVTLVLLHGGSGSWTHWLANIPRLAEQFHLVVPDLPGLGDAARLAPGYSAQDAADWTARGIGQVLGEKPFHLVGFSWGATLASLVAAQVPVDRLLSLVLVGPAALGELPGRLGMLPLVSRKPDMSEAELWEVNRENLARLMIFDRARIDDLAVYLQTENTRRARFNSPQFARTRLILEALAIVTAPLRVVYGEYDAATYPYLGFAKQQLASVRGDLAFEVLPGAGHWVQYELPEQFNEGLIRWIVSNTVLAD